MSRIPVRNRSVSTRRQTQLGLAEQPPPIWPFAVRPTTEERLAALEVVAANDQ